VLFQQEHAFESSQKYKEGKYIIELAHMVKENQWDWDKARVNQLGTQPVAPLFIRPSTTCGSPDSFDDPWVIPEDHGDSVDHSTPSCPSLVSCFSIIRHLISVIWQSVWRWPLAGKHYLFAYYNYYYNRLMFCPIN